MFIEIVVVFIFGVVAWLLSQKSAEQFEEPITPRFK